MQKTIQKLIKFSNIDDSNFDHAISMFVLFSGFCIPCFVAAGAEQVFLGLKCFENK